jgi:hypothetical protein
VLVAPEEDEHIKCQVVFAAGPQQNPRVYITFAVMTVLNVMPHVPTL